MFLPGLSAGNQGFNCTIHSLCWIPEPDALGGGFRFTREGHGHQRHQAPIEQIAVIFARFGAGPNTGPRSWRVISQKAKKATYFGSLRTIEFVHEVWDGQQPSVICLDIFDKDEFGVAYIHSLPFAFFWSSMCQMVLAQCGVRSCNCLANLSSAPWIS